MAMAVIKKSMHTLMKLPTLMMGAEASSASLSVG